MASLIIEDLEKVGVKAVNEPIPWNTYYEEVYKGYNYDLAILNIVGYPDPSRILSRYEGESGKNMPGYINSEYDKLIIRYTFVKYYTRVKFFQDYAMLLINLFYLFMFGCVGFSLLHKGFF